MDTLPTSPAKHFALVRKLKKQNISTLSKATIMKFRSTNSSRELRISNGTSTANE